MCSSHADPLPATPLEHCSEILLSADARAPASRSTHAHTRRLWDGARLLPDFAKLILPSFPGKDFAQLFPQTPPALVDLLQRLLVLDPDRRLSPAEALAHPFLNKRFCVQRARGEAVRDEWEWWSREVDGDGAGEADACAEPQSGAVDAACAEECSKACVGAQSGAVLLVGAAVGAGEDEEDRRVLQALVQVVLAARVDEDNEWELEPEARTEGAAREQGLSDVRPTETGGPVPAAGPRPGGDALDAARGAADADADALDEELTMDVNLYLDNPPEPAPAPDTLAATQPLPLLPPPLTLPGLDATDADEAGAGLDAEASDDIVLNGLESLSSEGVLNLQSYRARAMQLTSPADALGLRSGNKRDGFNTLLPTQNTTLPKRSGSNRHDLTGDEDAFLASVYAESEECDLDSTTTMDLFGVRRMGWDTRDPQDAVHYEDDEETNVPDVESMFPDDVAIPGQDYDFLLGPKYEFFEPWMNYECVDYDNDESEKVPPSINM